MAIEIHFEKQITHLSVECIFFKAMVLINLSQRTEPDAARMASLY